MSNADFFPMERNRYFYGKLLTVRDFEIEQHYNRSKTQLFNRLRFGAGVVCGERRYDPADRKRHGAGLPGTHDRA